MPVSERVHQPPDDATADGRHGHRAMIDMRNTRTNLSSALDEEREGEAEDRLE